MTPVENRIAAARYFLRILVENDPPYPEFDWLLEAFITAARSVSWLMKATAPDQAIYAEWDRSTPPSPEVQQLFTQIAKIRNRVQKTGVIESKFGVTLEIDATGDALLLMSENSHLSEGDRFEVEVDLSIDKESGRVEVRHRDGKVLTGRLAYSFNAVDEFRHEHVLDQCERYLQHLEAGYADWQKFCAARLSG